jgi:hypothetical protein
MGLNSNANVFMTSLQVNDKIHLSHPNIYGAYFLFDIL